MSDLTIEDLKAAMRTMVDVNQAWSLYDSLQQQVADLQARNAELVEEIKGMKRVNRMIHTKRPKSYEEFKQLIKVNDE